MASINETQVVDVETSITQYLHNDGSHWFTSVKFKTNVNQGYFSPQIVSGLEVSFHFPSVEVLDKFLDDLQNLRDQMTAQYENGTPATPVMPVTA